MNYYDLRKEVAKLIPRQGSLSHVGKKLKSAVKEKGRKSNYYQFDLAANEWKKNERLLNTEEFKSFIEISLRAAACPMPLNVDVWDGLLCAYRCQYCFADAFRASLYTSFFDNSKSLGYRSCSPDYFKAELDKYLGARSGLILSKANDIQRAVYNNVPIRIGIRFEDFLPLEEKRGVSLELLKYLAESHYPVMINTKSDLPSLEPYISCLSRNPAKAAVHITLISSNNKILKDIEPGAPSYERRLEAMRVLSSAGVRVVARIEPYMVFINDEKEDVEKYMEEVYDAGIRNITFDTYSYSANNQGIRANFNRLGYDFNRMFLLTSDSQAVGSLLLKEFMELFKQKGFRCSTFDLGNVPGNGDDVCCEIGDWFSDSKFNQGSIVSAIRFVQRQEGKPVAWSDYEKFVEDNGGFLSSKLKEEVFGLWNLSGNPAYSIEWAAGIVSAGVDSEGIQIWKYEKQDDFRMKVLKGIL